MGRIGAGQQPAGENTGIGQGQSVAATTNNFITQLHGKIQHLKLFGCGMATNIDNQGHWMNTLSGGLSTPQVQTYVSGYDGCVHWVSDGIVNGRRNVAGIDGATRLRGSLAGQPLPLP